MTGALAGLAGVAVGAAIAASVIAALYGVAWVANHLIDGWCK